MYLANQLKTYRASAGFSQEIVAQKLNISRQSLSKWENGRGYPDVDNLVRLSELYQVSVDELLRENKQLKKGNSENDKKIKEKNKKIKYIVREVEKDEGLLLLLLAGIASFIFPIGLILVIFSIWKNKKTNSFYKLVYLVCILALFFNIYAGYGHLSNYLGWGQTTIEKID